MKTKDLIYFKSIELFASQSYETIGMREIAKHVGIKAASIYNHYKSKEDILLQIAATLVNKMKEDVYPLYKVSNIDFKIFFTNIAMKTNDFFERVDVAELVKILVPLFYQSEKLKELIHLEFYVKPRAALAYYFNDLTKRKLLNISDSVFAAKVYHSFFIYHFFEKYLLNNSESFLNEHKELFLQHIEFFLSYFNINKELPS